MVSNKKIILEININVKAQSEWEAYKVKGGATNPITWRGGKDHVHGTIPT